MDNQRDILNEHLSLQIALEEHLCRTIEEQILEIDKIKYGDAATALVNTSETLARHFLELSGLLDKLERNAGYFPKRTVGTGSRSLQLFSPNEPSKGGVSTILCEDYSALTFITISKTQLHTIALAFDFMDVAAVALEHLESLAPSIVTIGELVPAVVARELQLNSPKPELSVSRLLLENTKSAWRRSGRSPAGH